MCIYPQDLLIEACEAGLMLFHQQRIRATLPISWDGELDRSSIALERLGGVSVAVIGASLFCPLILLVAEMRGSFRLEAAIDQCRTQLFDDTFWPKEILLSGHRWELVH